MYKFKSFEYITNMLNNTTKRRKLKRSRRRKLSKTKKLPKVENQLSLPSFSFNRTEKTALKKTHSYQPTFYNDMTRRHSKSPMYSIVGNKKIVCKDDEIYNKNTGKCYNWNSNVARKLALKNLNSKKKFNIDDIVGPKQILSNCWLNCFFVIYFLSDKGRSFYHHMRRTMITGKNVNGKYIKKNNIRLIFIFNKYIESVIRGQHSNINKKYALNL